MNYLKFLGIAIIAIINLNVNGQENVNNKAIIINSSIIIDNVSNFSGGIETGNSTLGLLDFNIDYKPFQKGLFRRTSFYIHLLKTAGKGSSETFIGDTQAASNIEGQASRFIYEFVVNQQLGNFFLTFGLHDLNTEFMMSDYAGDFINSSFGILPAVSLNVPVSIFPVTSLGGILSYHKKSFDIVGGLYNLNNDYIEEDVFNLRNHTFQNGYMGVIEFRYRLFLSDKLSGEYKIGSYYKDCAPSVEQNEGEKYIVCENHGVYFIADQLLFSVGEEFSLGMFTQFGLAPKKTNFVPDYYGAGLSVRTKGKAYLPEFIGLGIGRVGLNDYSAETGYFNPKYETAIELSAKKTLFNRITLQPDIQYILNPSGIYDNALVGLIRFQIELNN